MESASGSRTGGGTQQQYGDESAPPPAAYSLHATTMGGKDEGESGPPPSRAPTRQARAWLVVVVACVAWLSCSTSIIVVNRTVMMTLNFRYPLALSAWGQFVSGVVAWVICRMEMVPPIAPLSLALYAKTILPVAIAQGSTIVLSNSLYMYLTISFIEMARALLPLFTMVALYLAKLESPTPQLVRAVILTAIGCAISAYGEVQLHIVGVILLTLNFCFEGVRLVTSQYLLQSMNYHPWQTLRLVALPSSLILGALSLIFEMSNAQAPGAASPLSIVMGHLPTFLAAGLLGIAVNFLSSLIIKLAGATTLKVLAAVRGPLIVVSGIILFSEKVTRLQFCGYSIALAGFCLFNYAKATQMKG